jgi:hypothetical protein
MGSATDARGVAGLGGRVPGAGDSPYGRHGAHLI